MEQWWTGGTSFGARIITLPSMETLAWGRMSSSLQPFCVKVLRPPRRTSLGRSRLPKMRLAERAQRGAQRLEDPSSSTVSKHHGLAPQHCCPSSDGFGPRIYTREVQLSEGEAWLSVCVRLSMSAFMLSWLLLHSFHSQGHHGLSHSAHCGFFFSCIAGWAGLYICGSL